MGICVFWLSCLEGFHAYVRIFMGGWFDMVVVTGLGYRAFVILGYWCIFFVFCSWERWLSMGFIIVS